MTPARIAVALIPLLASVACGGDDAADDGPVFAFALPDEAGRPIDTRRLPFPNDALFDDAGELAITAETLPFEDDADAIVTGAMARAFQELDCFGVSGGVSFPTDRLGADAIDADTLADAARIVDLASGETLPAELHYRTKDKIVHVRPTREHRLAEARRYAVYLRGRIATATGDRVGAAPDLRQLLADETPAPRLAIAHQAYAPLRAHLAGDADDIVAATVISTCVYSPFLEAIAASLAERAAPEVVVDRVYEGAEALDGFLGAPVDGAGPGFDNEGGIAHDAIAAVVLGHYESPYFLSETPGTLGRIEVDAGGAPLDKSTDRVTFLLALPAGVDGYENLPLVVLQHGLNSSRRHVLAAANTLAAHGLGVIGIDIPFHGDRHADARDQQHEFTDAATPDGLADGSLVAVRQFFNILDNDGVDRLDPLVMADNFRQSAIDLIVLAQVVTESDPSPIADALAGVEALSFDADRVVYASISFGGFVGVTAIAFAPVYGAAWFNVAGGGLADQLLGNSGVYGPLFIPIIAGTFSVAPNDLDPLYDPPHTHYSFQILSMLLDGGDPLTYAPRLRERDVHVVLASAYSDEAVPNQSSEALAMQLGLPWAPVAGAAEAPQFVTDYERVALPASGNASGATAGFFELEPATHGMVDFQRDDRNFAPGFPPFEPLDPPLEIANPIVRLQTLMARFAASYAETGTPTLEAGDDVE